jgi:hypothetical protein
LGSYLEIDLPARQPVRRVVAGGRLAALRGERAMIVARYDSGAMPPCVYAVVRLLEIEISEMQMRAGA